MIGSFRERGRRTAAMGLVIALALSVAPLLTASPAAADPGTPHTVRATTPHQTSVAPNGPLTGLVNGDTISIHVEQQSSSNPIFGVDSVRECQGGSVIHNDAEMVPSNTGLCLDTPLSSGTNNVTGPAAKDPAATGVDISFKVGTGGPEAVVYDDGSPGSPHTNNISCNGTTDCRLWIQIARTGGNDFVFYDLQFLGNPGAPGVTAACTASGATVTLTAPTVTGHAPIASYTVHATPTDGGTQPADVVVTAPATTGSFTTFQTFSKYDITATATNAGGLTGPASVAGGSTLGVQTCAPGPVLAPAVIAPGQATLSWTYTTPPGFTGFVVTYTDTTTGTPPQTKSAAASPTTLTGLTTGDLYSATVHAVYSNGISAESNAVTFSPPPNSLITQTITVRRPAGALVLTQVCGAPGSAGTTPTLAGGGADPLFPQYPYPQDPTTGDAVANYPTNCNVAMGPASLIKTGPGAGQFFQASAPLNTVTVVDTRDTDPGWTVNGRMGDFTQPLPGAIISGDELGWTPAKTSDTGPVTYSDGTTYDQTVTAGPMVLPNQPNGTGLGSASGKVLGSAAATKGLGIAVLDGVLNLYIPITARTGNYTGVLTVTAV